MMQNRQFAWRLLMVAYVTATFLMLACGKSSEGGDATLMGGGTKRVAPGSVRQGGAQNPVLKKFIQACREEARSLGCLGAGQGQGGQQGQPRQQAQRGQVAKCLVQHARNGDTLSDACQTALEDLIRFRQQHASQ